MGRLTIDKGNIPATKFSNAPKFGFFLPRRCASMAAATATGNLCAGCQRRMETLNVEIPTKGLNNIQNQSDKVHGLVTEPVPDWSRLYGGKKIGALLTNKGYTIDADTMVKVEEAFAESVKGLDCDIMEIMGASERKVGVEGTDPKKPKAKAKAKPKAKERVEEPQPIATETKVETPKPVTTSMPTPKPAPTPNPVTVSAPTLIAIQPKPKAKKKAPAKQQQSPVTPSTFRPQFIIDSKPLDISELTVSRISAKMVSIDDRDLYLSSTGDIYDLKYKHIGRYNQQDDTIEYEDAAEEEEDVTTLRIFDLEAP